MKNRSQKFVFLVISVVVITGLACGAFSRTDPTATEQPLVQFEPPTEVAIIEEPTPTDPPTQEPLPTETSTQEPTPTDTPGPVVEVTEAPQEEDADAPPAWFTENFDGDLSSWTYFLMNGSENNMDLFTDRGRLVFDLRGINQWVYVTYDEYYYSDVRIELKAENLGRNSNNVSLICHYSDRLGWYEFNISNGGLYWIFAYSELEGDWIELARGGSNNVRMGRDVNTYTAVCRENRLALYINGVLEREYVDRRFNMREGLVGFSVASFDVLPILVEVDYFSISYP